MNSKIGLTLALAAAVLVAGTVYWWSSRPLETPSQAELAATFPRSASKLLESAPQLTLFSLWSKQVTTETDLGPQPFHGYKVLGKTTVRGEAKTQLMAHFYDAIAQKGKFAAACFAPHHGIRAEQNGQVVDLLICFSCGQIKTYGLGPVGKSTIIGKRGEKFFDSVLRDAGIEIQDRR